MKFGGTSMGDLERIRRAARIVAAEAAAGKQVAVVVSAMAGKTNELVAWTDGAGRPGQGVELSDDEYDIVVASGEQVTAGLLALTLRNMGLIRGASLALSGDEAAARLQIGAVERAVRARPEMALPLANILALVGRYSDARGYFDAAKKRNPRDPAAHVGLARTQLALGGFEESAGHALDALEITQSLPEAHLVLGAALAWYGDLANARTSLEFALRHDPGQLDAERWLTVVAEKLGDGAGAESSRARVARAQSSMPFRPKDAPFGPADFAKKHGLAAI